MLYLLLVSAAAEQLSAGEKQLMALARTLLRRETDRPQIIVMDEPTANIDSATDEMVQRVIQQEFAGCTLITIAHRLNTVMGGDRMLVMDAGRVGEYDVPHNLLCDSASLLSEFVEATGPASAQQLRNLARNGLKKG